MPKLPGHAIPPRLDMAAHVDVVAPAVGHEDLVGYEHLLHQFAQGVADPHGDGGVFVVGEPVQVHVPERSRHVQLDVVAAGGGHPRVVMPARAHRDGDVLFSRVFHRQLHILDVRTVDDGAGRHDVLVVLDGGGGVLVDAGRVVRIPTSNDLPGERGEPIVVLPIATERIEGHSACYPERHPTSSLVAWPEARERRGALARS
jgi:hypothetical protein